MKNQKLSSGEIARICKLNKKTLFYYDQINLLKPAIVEANGYRYYSPDQIDRLSKIKALQSVGFSLAEIKQQLYVNDISEGIATLNRQKQIIEGKANELVAVKNTLDLKIVELEHYDQIGINQVYIKNFNKEWLYVDRPSPQEELIANYLFDGYHFGIMLGITDHPAEKIEITKYKLMDNGKKANFKKEKGRYVGIYFISGGNHIIADALNAMTRIRESGYPLSGQAFVKDIASDFVNFEDGNIPFQMTIKWNEM
ncbi:MerR family transcriptional regulator [Psychrobacillus psychrodurans]|uniref:MerR family transcriptional regulator n=1 Tax=Psychrobacillus psychrodurans TaxID=126157 RepID=A0A9X3LEG2_9BACI|nr:MerR family transcriptional regulator [Psychrobacillus psychrodurans]MCZ8535401.1 MerR family transcriptional regulator [Psychrobacillus psychrodurans]